MRALADTLTAYYRACDSANTIADSGQSKEALVADSYGGMPLIKGMTDQSLSRRRGADSSQGQLFRSKAIDVMKAYVKNDVSNETGV